MADPTRLIDYDRQVQEAMLEHIELTTWEIVCWNMFGIRTEWVMDELLIEAP